jgi:hypothetical protein
VKEAAVAAWVWPGPGQQTTVTHQKHHLIDRHGKQAGRLYTGSATAAVAVAQSHTAAHQPMQHSSSSHRQQQCSQNTRSCQQRDTAAQQAPRHLHVLLPLTRPAPLLLLLLPQRPCCAVCRLCKKAAAAVAAAGGIKAGQPVPRSAAAMQYA